jgi:hypothetical protein
MDYIDTIKRGFAHTWNNKFMWVLGFLAALGSGAAGSNSNYQFNANDAQELSTWATPERMAALTAGLAAFACIAVIVGIILWLVALSARGGMIGAVAQMEQGTGKPTFRSAFRMGWSKVWRLAGMSIVLFIVPVILFIALGVAFIVPVASLAIYGGSGEDMSALGTALGGAGIVALCLLCLLVPFTIVLSFIQPFAFRGIVLRDMGIRESIRHGWNTLKSNLGEIILLGLAFFLINIIVFIVAAAILVPVALAVGVPIAMLAESNATVITGILAALGIIVGLIVFALVSAIATAWQSSTFTLGYLRWTGKQVSIPEA